MRPVDPREQRLQHVIDMPANGEPMFGWEPDNISIRRRCWIVRPLLHPVTIVLICVCILCIAVLGLLGFFIVLFCLVWALYKFYI